MIRALFFSALLLFCFQSNGQLTWQNVDAAYGPLPPSVHVFYTNQRIDTAPFRAFYLVADLKERKIEFTTDTTAGRRITPQQFYEKNGHPVAVVNGTFFSFETNGNLNTVIRDGKTLSFDTHLRELKGKDTLMYAKHLASAIGISKKRQADVAWIYNAEGRKSPVAFERNPVYIKDSVKYVSLYTFAPQMRHYPKMEKRAGIRERWKMQTAIGGGPVLLQDGAIRVTNNEENKFPGKGISDKHPRTAMGYTADNRLVILVVEGRNAQAGGATLTQLAQILKDLSCVEALNLDGGGSSCLLVNGKETITPSDKTGQRPVPAVFIIK